MNYILINIISYFQETIKVRQVRLINIVLVSLLIGFAACNEKVTGYVIINDFQVNKAETILHPNEGKWYFQNTPLNGYAVEFYENGQIKERIGYYDGKKQGIAKFWYEDGSLAKESYYEKNQLNGTIKSWWPDGALSTVSNYQKGKRHGEQKVWYANGQLSRKTMIKEGIEDGLQQAWLENGKIYVNYEAKNGRVFGLKRANMCYKLKNEIVETK